MGRARLTRTVQPTKAPRCQSKELMIYPPLPKDQSLPGIKSLRLVTATDARRFAFAYVTRAQGHLGMFFGADNETSLRAAIQRSRNEPN